jgi:multiple sugar transport system permease protein
MKIIDRLIRWIGKTETFKRLSVLPVSLVLNFVLIVPFAIMIFLSFTIWEPLVGYDWWHASIAGVPRFVEAFGDARLLWALVRTTIFVAVVLPLEFLLGLGMAILFLGDFRGKRGFTSLIMYPMMMPWVVVGLGFYLMFQNFGPVNLLLLKPILGEGMMIDWFTNPVLAFVVIMIADIWQWTPLMFLIIYAGLAAVPRRLVEAAEVLGASSVRILRTVRLPLIKSLAVVALIIRGLEAFKVFDIVYIITGGGPGVNSTEVISLYVYNLSIVYHNTSYACAVSLIIMVGIALVTRLAIRPLEVKVE